MEETILWENINHQNCPKKERLRLSRLNDIVETLKVKYIGPPFQKFKCVCLF